MKILAIIPARCGSKGIQLKNVVSICGKPLIQYTIEVTEKLIRNSLITESIISTDCVKIADISKKLGGNVPFLRPANISGDKAKSISYILHALEHFEKANIYFDAVITLQPTSVLKTYSDIKKAIELFRKHDSDSLISVYKDAALSQFIMYKKEGNYGVAFNVNHNRGVRRQDHEITYIRNGAIYITKTSFLKKNEIIISDKPLIFVMSKKNSLNIDSSDELDLARQILCK